MTDFNNLHPRGDEGRFVKAGGGPVPPNVAASLTGSTTPTSRSLRDDPEEFAELRDAAADELGMDAGAIEKDYWATEVLRSVTRPLEHVRDVIFKGGTSLSKAYGIIERFSEDIDVIAVVEPGLSNSALKKTLRRIADRASSDLALTATREHEGRGYLNARYAYPAALSVPFLTPGVLLEMGTRGGPNPHNARQVSSYLADAARRLDPLGVATDCADLQPFTVYALAPERTLAEKLAFLHHRASANKLDELAEGARHLYDVALILRHNDTLAALKPGHMAELMVDVDARSAAANWGLTPRPTDGFAASPAFHSSAALDALRSGYTTVADLAWGRMPTFDEALRTITDHADNL